MNSFNLTPRGYHAMINNLFACTHIHEPACTSLRAHTPIPRTRIHMQIRAHVTACTHAFMDDDQAGIGLQFKVLARFLNPVLQLFEERAALFILATCRHDL